MAGTTGSDLMFDNNTYFHHDRVKISVRPGHAGIVCQVQCRLAGRFEKRSVLAPLTRKKDRGMKILLHMMLIILLLTGSIAFGSDLKDGFLGKRWGAEAGDLTGFTKIRDNGTVSFYVQPEEVHVINNTKVPHVVYGFFSGRLFAVYVRIDSDELFNEIKSYMISKYGNPSTTLALKSEQKTYRWKYKKIKMKLKFSQKKEQMKLAVYYTPISNKVNEDQQESFHDEAFRFFPIDKDRKPETLPSIPLLRF